MKHTPGPWRATSGGRYVVAPETDDYPELRVQLEGGNPDLNKANARLIAASPQLLLAVECLIKAMPMRRDWLDPDIERLARDAFTKATGQSL